MQPPAPQQPRPRLYLQRQQHLWLLLPPPHLRLPQHPPHPLHLQHRPLRPSRSTRVPLKSESA